MKYSDEQKKDYAQMVLDQCHGTDFPILFNVDIGHTDPSKHFLTGIYFFFSLKLRVWRAHIPLVELVESAML